MRTLVLILSMFTSVLGLCIVAQDTSIELTYPKVQRINKTWSFRSAKANGNVTYDDPYYWLEEYSTNDTSVQQFIADQSNLTETFLKRCTNLKEIRQSIQQAADYDQYSEVAIYAENTGSPFYLYSLKRIGDQRPTWYKASVAEFEAGKNNNFQQPPGKPYLNESFLSAKGTANIVEEGIIISPDGKIFCYLVSEGNSDFSTWYFRSLDNPLINAQNYPLGGEGSFGVSIPFNQQSIKWTADSKGFFYTQAEIKGDTTASYKICYHHWGSSTDQDIVIVQPMLVLLSLRLSHDGRWLFAFGLVDNSYKQIAYASRLDVQSISEKMNWISISSDYEFQIFYITTINDTFYFQTDQNAVNSKIAKVKLDWSKSRPTSTLIDVKDRLKVIDVIKEKYDALIPQSNVFAIANDRVLINYIDSGKDSLYLYDLRTGKMLQHILPSDKESCRNAQLTFSVPHFKETASFKRLLVSSGSNVGLLEYTSWNTPTKIYELKYINGQIQTSTVTTQNVRGSKASDFAIDQYFAVSKDGTKVPYFVSRKGKSGNCRTTFVYAYGAFGLKKSLFYFPSFFTFINSYDTFFVWAAIRGGGDEGGEWHLNATTIHKQRSFDDWIAIVEDLVNRDFACPGQVIIGGASAGGMSALAVANQATQGLISVVLGVRAVTDYFMLSLRSRIGTAQFSEFGNPNIPEEFDAIRAWSPLQNIPNIEEKKEYPAVLLTPGEDDDRVSPAHSYKMIAQLQFDHPKNKLPLLMYVANSGHLTSASDTTSATLEASHQFCLIQEAIGLKPHSSS